MRCSGTRDGGAQQNHSDSKLVLQIMIQEIRIQQPQKEERIFRRDKNMFGICYEARGGARNQMGGRVIK